MEDLELVALMRDIADHGLRQADVGTIVYVHPGDPAYEVEFMTGSGRTLAVLTLPAEDARPMRDHASHPRRDDTTPAEFNDGA